MEIKMNRNNKIGNKEIKVEIIKSKNRIRIKK